MELTTCLISSVFIYDMAQIDIQGLKVQISIHLIVVTFVFPLPEMVPIRAFENKFGGLW